MYFVAIRKGRCAFSVKYEYFKSTRKAESDGLGEEGNSTDNRTSSMSSDIQAPDGEDILVLSIQKALQVLEEASPLPSRSINGSPCSTESDSL